MFPEGFGDILQIPSHYRKFGQVIGIENTPQKVYNSKIDIKACGKIFQVVAIFGKSMPYPLLGREGFLDYFILTMDYPNFFDLTPRAAAVLSTP